MDSTLAFLQNATGGPRVKHASPSMPPVPSGRRTLLWSHQNRSPRIPAIRSPLPPPGTPIRPRVSCVAYGRNCRNTDCDDHVLGTGTPNLRWCRPCDTFPSAFFPAVHLPLSQSPLSSVLRNPRRLPIFLKSLPSPFLRLPQRRRLVALAEGNGSGRGREDKEEEERKKGDTPPAAGGDELRNLLALDFRWRELLNPDPENIVAVALTGLLALASAQALWQLFFISIAIVLAALKYSFIAALLLFIVITLL